ncbi:hypothetical protein OXX69_003010 [Metschnikowia pulcherrima]
MSVAPLLVKQCRDTKSLLRFEKFMKRHMCRSRHVRFAIQRFSSDLIFFLRILLRKSFPSASLRNMDVGSSKKREDTAPSLKREDTAPTLKREEFAADKSVVRLRSAYHSFMECAGTGSLFGQLSDGTQIRLDNVHFAPIVAAIIISPNSVEDIQIMRFGNELVRFDNLTLTLHKKSVMGEAIGEAIGELQTVGVNVQIPTSDCQSVSVVQPSLEPRIIEVYDSSDDESAAGKLTFMPLQLVIVIQVTSMSPSSQMVRMSGTIALVISDMLNLDN